MVAGPVGGDSGRDAELVVRIILVVELDQSGEGGEDAGAESERRPGRRAAARACRSSTPATPPEPHFIPACTALQYGRSRLISIKR
ncbi:MAG: hypothetical protein JWQ49_4933, partial [Edaphobacter sp.]|nr:hypothetical protein [Edaphobacter sp.]